MGGRQFTVRGHPFLRPPQRDGVAEGSGRSALARSTSGTLARGFHDACAPRPARRLAMSMKHGRVIYITSPRPARSWRWIASVLLEALRLAREEIRNPGAARR